MNAAAQIAQAGQAFGRNLLEATEDMADASGAGGPGMAWKHRAEAFEFMLEKAEDLLRFYPDREDDARTLYTCSARIEFYGAHANKNDLKRWTRLGEDAFANLLAFSKAAA